MIVIGIVGWKNSGKTRLIKELIKYFSSKKYKVATIKHAHHNFEIDKVGTDSFAHRKAGANEILISSSKRWAKINEISYRNELKLNDLLTKIENSEIVLVEGFKKENHKKIEVVRTSETKKKPLYSSLKNVIALVSNEKLNINIPIFKDSEFEKIAKFIISIKNK
tara:strand:- start:611 stop:1105 length:495 start_codon:yes stop_codon:yes gene_type:complete